MENVLNLFVFDAKFIALLKKYRIGMSVLLCVQIDRGKNLTKLLKWGMNEIMMYSRVK